MSFANDLKVGMRQFSKSPGSMILAIMAFALGLGLVGLILALFFGVVKGHPKDIDFNEIQTLSWDNSTRHLWKSGAQQTGIRVTDFREIQENQDTFEHLAYLDGQSFNILINKYAERFEGSIVSSEVFDVLGVKPHIGSLFAPEDDNPGSSRKAVLGYSLWQKQFQGLDSIVGESLNINGEPTLIIGVAPENVDFPSQNQLWVVDTQDYRKTLRAKGSTLFVIGKLKEEHSVASALSNLNTIVSTMAETYPETNTGYISMSMIPLSQEFIGDTLTNMIRLLLACSLMVLLIACTNVANLTLSRSTTRMKELAIRASLGGKRKRLILQMLVEGLAVAFLGAIGGIIIAIWSSKAIWAWVKSSDQADPPIWMNMDVDIQVLAPLMLIALLASVFASIVPAIRASKTDVNTILKDNSRGASSINMGIFSKLLALAQLSVSCALLVATAALVESARESAVFEPPFYNPEEVMTARFELPETYFPNSQRSEALRRLQSLLENHPELEGVGFTSAFDMISNWNSRWDVKGRERQDNEDYLRARNEIVSDNYFDVLGIPVLYGRSFTSLDQGENAESVCIINEPLARRLWPDDIQKALGQQFRSVYNQDTKWATVIGIVPDTKMAGPGAHKTDEQQGGIYRPMSTDPQSKLTVFAKTDGNPSTQARHIRSVLNREDESIALYRIKTVETAVQDRQFTVIFFRNLFGMFGIAAFLLASIGIYGVMDFSIRQKFQEFSIRQALGASRSSIIKHIFKMSSWQIVLGLTIGGFLGYGLVGIMSQNNMVTPGLDASIFIVPALIIIVVSAIAIYTPARFVVNANLRETLGGD